MKIIQICGTNGTGKTTLVKGLLKSGKFLKMTEPVDGRGREWWYDGQVAIIGKYNANNCCGVDAGNYSGDTLLNVIDTLLRNYAPKTIVFEDVRYGGLYSFKHKAKALGEQYGYGYCAFTLIASLECVARRVIARTGNEGCDFDRMRSKARQCIKSTAKIGQEGAETVMIDTERFVQEAVLAALRMKVYGKA